MSIKLLPASVNPLDPSQTPEVSTSLVPLTQRAITTQAGQISLVPSADAFSWSSSTRGGGTNRIDATFVEDSQSGQNSTLRLGVCLRMGMGPVCREHGSRLLPFLCDRYRWVARAAH